MRVFIFKKVTLMRAVAFGLFFLCGALYAGAVARKDAAVFGEEKGKMPVCSVETKEKVIALTFDTTFGNDQTKQLLSVLKEKKAKATFAVMGIWAKRNPELLRCIVADGHDLISHSMNHGRYNEMKEADLLADAQESVQTLHDMVAVQTKYIRPPYGAANAVTVSVLEKAGYIPIRWSIDSRDWEEADAQTVKEKVLGKIQPGAIVVFQNNTENTLSALPEIIDALKERGYRCVGISDLVLESNYQVNQAGVQKQK